MAKQDANKKPSRGVVEADADVAAMVNEFVDEKGKNRKKFVTASLVIGLKESGYAVPAELL